MGQMKRPQINERTRRLADFSRRIHAAKAHSPESIMEISQRDWTFIAIHPMADEKTLLSRLNMKATDCVKADFYWRN